MLKLNDGDCVTTSINNNSLLNPFVSSWIYFVTSVVLKKTKQKLLPMMQIIIFNQWQEEMSEFSVSPR